jgi:outer membrane protein assembly factor BamB
MPTVTPSCHPRFETRDRIGFNRANGNRRCFSLPAACLTLAVLVAGNGVQAGDWPTYLGDVTRAGATANELTVPLKPAWTYSAPAELRSAWPNEPGELGRILEGQDMRNRVAYDDALHVAAVGDRVYFGSPVDHQVYCVDADTGKIAWTFFTDGPVRLAPNVWDGLVLFGSDDGYVYCLNANDGKLVWKLRAGPDDDYLLSRGEMTSRWPVRTSVLVDDGTAYFGAGIFPHEDVYLYAVEARTGKIVWKQDHISEQDAARNDLSPQGYLLANETQLFVPSGRALPVAIDRSTGKIIFQRGLSWRTEAGGEVGGTRALLADGQLYASGSHHMVAMDQKTGATGFGWFDGRQLAISGDAAFTATGQRIARWNRLEYAKASTQIQKLRLEVRNLSRSVSGAPAEKAKEIRKRIAEAEKEIEELEPVGVVWSQPNDAAAALLAAGNLLLAGGKGRVDALNPETGEIVWTAKIDGEARGLAVAGGRLHVSTDTGKIHTFSPTGGPQSDAVAKKTDPYPADDGKVREYARRILEATGVKNGFCLVVGSEQGRLAYELARQSNLKIYCVEPNEKKVAESRRLLNAAGLYGDRVTIHQADFAAIPYSNYFANLIVSETLLRTGQMPGKPADISRHVKPLGGTICLGPIAEANAGSNSDLTTWLQNTGLAEQAEITTKDGFAMLVRGALPGAGSWTHQYAEPGNTAASEDRLVKGGLGVLWYGDPGPDKMVNRHDGAVGPLAVAGKLIIQGADSVLAYDAYNGQFLWEVENPQALRTGVFQNYNPGNVVASDERVFIMIRDEVIELDIADGSHVRTHKLPPEKAETGNELEYEWGYLAYRDGRLYGTATIRKELEQRLRRRGRQTDDVTDAIFAIDVKTGKHLWTYQGKSISHHTIALSAERVFFIDSSITSEQRADLLRQNKDHLKDLTGEAAKQAEQRLKRFDVRMAVALDSQTGEQQWSQPVDVTDCSEIGIGGGKLTLIHQNGVLLLCGANANGHYWKQFIDGEFAQRRLVALTGASGDKLWAKDANYRHRPIIIEDRIIAEPWAFDLYSGEQLMRAHPQTGEQVPWSMIRPGHHCGMLVGCTNMLLFRSGSTGFYNLDEDDGTRHFAGHRLGCWINAIPANGVVMIPEASAGCVCLFSIASTITLEPREARRPWTIYSAIGDSTPVRKMSLNLGAPGDRKDARGTVWLAYPRPKPGKDTGLDLPLKLNEKKLSGGGFESIGSSSVEVTQTETPWLFTSWAEGVTSFSLPLLGKDDAPASYTLRLHFADISEQAAAGQRVFDLKVQGETVLEGFDVAAAAGGRAKAVVHEIPNVQVKDKLLLELLPQTDGQSPILSAIEVMRE